MDRMRRLDCCFNQFLGIGEGGGCVLAIEFQFACISDAMARAIPSSKGRV